MNQPLSASRMRVPLVFKAGLLVLLGAVAYRQSRTSRRPSGPLSGGVTPPLDPRMKVVGILLQRAPGPSMAEITAEELIERSSTPHSGLLFRLITGWPRRGVRQEDRTIPTRAGSLLVRVYTPERPSGAPRPLVLAFHGGGWVQGELNMADWMSSTVAADLDAVVVSVGYRLAPEYPFPAAVEDCFDALTWCAANRASLGAEGRVGVMGESAGGNLAAVVCLLARDQGGPVIDHQALIYPATDIGHESESRRRNAHQIILTAADMSAYEKFYIPAGTPKTDWRIAPLRAASHAGLPPALIQVAGYDALHDDGVRYAEVLRAAGVPVVLDEYPSMPHGFTNFPYFSRDARPAMKQVVAQQRTFLKART